MPTILSSAQIAHQKGQEEARARETKRRRELAERLESSEVTGWPDREHDALAGEPAVIERRYLTAADEDLRAELGRAQAELVRRGVG